MSGGIRYALISRQKVVLCDYTAVPGSYERASLTVLDNLSPNKDTRISFEVGTLVYHVVVSGPLVFMCVSDPVFDRGLAFGCLAQLETRLANSPSLTDKAEYVGPYALRRYFSNEMEQVLDQYSSGDKLAHLESQVTSVTGVMTRNLEKVMQRGETLDDLEDRSERLAHSSTDFRQSAIKLKRKERCRSVRLWLIIVIVLSVILLVIVIAIVIGVLAATKQI